MRAVAVVMCLLFLFSAGLQWNDPDPVRWMALYGAAAVASALCALGRSHAHLSLCIALAAVMWAGVLVPEWLGNPSAISHILDDWEMHDPGVEVSRELLGLLIVVAWTLAIGTLDVRRRQLQTN
jgi:hypothetical protein